MGNLLKTLSFCENKRFFRPIKIGPTGKIKFLPKVSIPLPPKQESATPGPGIAEGGYF